MSTISSVPQDAAAGGRLRLKFARFLRLLAAGGEDVSIPAAVIARPSSGMAPRLERFLKRAIPLLILAFLVVVAASRTFGIAGEHGRMEDYARQSTTLAAAAAAAAFAGQESLFAEADRTGAEARLDGFVKSGTLDAATVVLFVDVNGRVFGGTGDTSRYVGRRLASMLPETAALRRIDDSAGVIETYFGETPFYAAIKPVGSDGALIVAAHSLEAANQFTRSEISFSVTIFAGISAILLAILYAYYIQVKRTRDAHDVFLQSNLRIETALSRGRCGLWDFDVTNKRLFWSGSLYEMLGLPPVGNIVSFTDAARMMHPTDGNIYALARTIARGNDKQVDQVFRMRHAAGHYVWMRARAQVVKMANGRTHVIGIAMDVTEQHRLAQRYAEADQRLADAIECTSEAFVLWDKNDRLVMCNAHFQQAYGLPDSVLVPGTERAVVLSASARPVIARRVADADGSGLSRTTEVQLADERWLQINERRTRDGGTVSVGTDITLLKRNQERLRDSERRLMATIGDLSRSQKTLENQKSELSIANANYQAEKERAQAANRAKSEFLANMSHELRTPLNAILGFSEILMNGMFGPLGSPKYTEYSRDIHDSGKHLLNVINDILDMSKIEAGHMCIQSEAIDLTPLIDESLRLTAIAAQTKRISIRQKFSGDLGLTGDRRAMKQVMLNLLSNAVKFTGEGGRIELRAKRVGTGIVLTIADTGIGIPKASMSKIGQPFEQVQGQYAKSQGGSGLGLAISRSLVRLHGGTMRIRSKVDEGTVISLNLPAQQPVVTLRRRRAA